MNLSTLVESIEAVAEAPGTAPQQRADATCALVTTFLLDTVARDRDRGQASILMDLTGKGFLTFTYPKHLASGNALPIDRNSIAGRVFLKRNVYVRNDIPKEPHKAFYERLKDPKGQVREIQKMVAVPILTPDGEVIGVIEVSRTGEAPEAAGPDFTAEDGERLEQACRTLAPYLAVVREQLQSAE